MTPPVKPIEVNENDTASRQSLQQSSKMRCRRVTFKNSVAVRALTHCMSDQQIVDEKNAKWYSQHELLRMRKRHIRVIFSLDTVSPSDREILKNVYGIDSVESKNARQERIRTVRMAILQEQERQYTIGQNDAMRLANEVTIISGIAAKEAQIRGIHVMREVVRDNVKEAFSGPTLSIIKKGGPLGRTTPSKAGVTCERYSSPIQQRKSPGRSSVLGLFDLKSRNEYDRKYQLVQPWCHHETARL